MKKLAIALATLVVATMSATVVTAQTSTWTGEVVLKGLGDRPTGWSSSSAHATLNDEVLLDGAARLDPDEQDARIRVGVYVKLTTDGVDSNEGLDDIVATHWTDAGVTPGADIIGLDTLVGGLYFSGSGDTVTPVMTDTFAGNSANVNFYSTLVSKTQATANTPASWFPGATFIDSLETPNGRRTVYVLLFDSVFLAQQIRGMWCDPGAGSSCEIPLGILEVDLANLPEGYDSFSVSWGSAVDDKGEGEAKMIASHRRATVNSVRGTNHTVETLFCDGAECATDWVQFSFSNYDLVEGTNLTGTDRNSQSVCVHLFNPTAALSENLVVPIDLVADSSTAARAAFEVTDGATTTHIDRTTADGDLSFNLTFPSGAQSETNSPVEQCFSVIAVPNADDPAGTGAAEDTTVAFTFGDGFSAPTGSDIATSLIESTTVTIKDDDGPDFTVTLKQSDDSSSSAAAEGASETNEFLVNVGVDVELEETVTIVLTPTLAGGATADDFTIPNSRISDSGAGVELMDLTFDAAANTITITLDGRVGPATEGLNFRVIAVDDSDSDVGESVTLALNATQSTDRITLAPAAGLVVRLIDDDSNTIMLSLDTETIAEDGTAPNPLTVTATVILSDTTGTLGNTNELTLSVGIDSSSTAAKGSGATDDYNIPSITGTSFIEFPIPAGAEHNSTVTVDITDLTIINDTAVEPAETIVFSMSSLQTTDDPPVAVTNIQVESTTFTITDDAGDTATLTLAGPSAVTEGDDASFTFSVDRRIESDFVVEWAFVAPSSTAVAREDFAPGQEVQGEIPFEGPVETTTVIAPIIFRTANDSLSEGAETIALTANIRGSDVVDSVQSNISVHIPDVPNAPTIAATGTIAANDDLTISLDAPETANEGDTVTFSAELTGGVATTNIRVALGLSSTTPSGQGNPATPAAPEDLGDGTETTFPETFIIIDAGSVTGSTNVTIFKDTVQDPETLVMELSNPQFFGDHDDDDQTADDWGAISGYPGTIALSTTAADIRKETRITEIGTVEVSLDATPKAEDAATVADRTFTATVSFGGDTISGSGNVDITWTVNIDDEENTDENITADAADFTSPLTGTLQFARGATTPADQTFDIIVADDTFSEQAEGFMVTLEIVGTEADVRVRSNEVRGSIDASDPITLVLSGPVDADNNPITRFAEGTSAVFTVTANGGTTANPFDVNLTIGASSSPTVDEIDLTLPRFTIPVITVADQDVMVDGTITFARETAQAGSEENENVNLELSLPQSVVANVTLPAAATEIIIIDNIVSVESGPNSGVGNEGEAIVLTFRVNEGTTGSGVLQFAIAEFAQNYEAAVGEDPVETKDLTLPAPLEVSFDGTNVSPTVPIPIVDDALTEGAETFTVVLLGWKEESGAPPSIADNAFVGDNTREVVTINASDLLTVSLSVDGGATRVTEGQSITLVATATGGTSSTPVIVTVGLDASSVVDVDDIASLSADNRRIEITIPEGDDSASVNVEFETNVDAGATEPETENLVLTIVDVTGGGGPNPTAGGDDISIVVENALAATLDVNDDGQITELDGQAIHWVISTPATYGSGPSPQCGTQCFPTRGQPGRIAQVQRGLRLFLGANAEYEALKGLVDKVYEAREAVTSGRGGSPFDITGDSQFTELDGQAIHWVKSTPATYGSGPSPQCGTQCFPTRGQPGRIAQVQRGLRLFLGANAEYEALKGLVDKVYDLTP